MNNYPEWWNETITVYNKFEDPQTRVITWYRTEIRGCFWKYVGDKVTVNQTTLSTDATICRIPKSTNFIEKYLWNDLGANKSQYFTLSAGDIIVRGSVQEDINEYSSGQRSSDFLNKYRKLQGCMLIERCTLNVDGGRGNEHYHVKGV